MGTWLEARLAKEARQRRERRYFTPDRRGPRCPECGLSTSRALVEARGTAVHPTCDPEARALIEAASS